MRLRDLACVAVLAAITGAPSIAHATLVGDTITIEALFPDSLTLFADDVVVVASPGAELSCPAAPGTFALCDSYYTVNTTTLNIEAASIRQEYNDPFGFYAGAAFNGHRFSDLDFSGGDVLTGFVLTTNLAGLSAALVSFTGDSIMINLQGLDPSADNFWQLDLLTTPSAIPEPGSLLLLGAGLAGLGLRRWRRR